MKKRVLIVEDDAALSRVLRDNFAFEGFEVESVADGDLAIAAARSFAPDLVVLDVMLPGRNGFELVGLLREGGRIPIIMLTARGQKADKLRGLDLGADDYVTKPFDLEELLARARAVLRRASGGVDRLVLGRSPSTSSAMEASRRRQASAPDPSRVRVASLPGRAPASCGSSRRTASRGVGLPRHAGHAVGGPRGGPAS